MRLIDAEAMMDDVIERYCKECNKRRGIKNGKWKVIYQIGDAPCRACSIDDMKEDIERFPTIDAVEVVRCKDCRWGHLCVFGQHLGLDGFCSKGERKEQDDG